MSLASAALSFIPNRISWTKVVGVKRSPLITEYSKADLLRLQMFCKDCVTEYSWTPDWPELEEKQDYQPVFLYCNLMRGGALHHVIDGLYKTQDAEGLSINPYVFSGRPNWQVWQTKDGRDSFPIAFASGAPIPKLTTSPGTITKYPLRGYIKGRLYYIHSSVMKELDKVKQNGVLFDRRKIWIKYPYRIQDPNNTGVNPSEEQIHPMEVWMYVGREEYWGEVPHINLERCGISHFSLKRHRNHPQKEGMYEHKVLPIKKWINDEPFYYFRAWEIANK